MEGREIEITHDEMWVISRRGEVSTILPVPEQLVLPLLQLRRESQVILFPTSFIQIKKSYRTRPNSV